MSAQQSYHRALKVLYPELFRIVFGEHSYSSTGAKLPLFGIGGHFDRSKTAHVWKIEEKKTDVNIAISIYRAAMKNLFDQIIVCSNDSDIEPALRAVREDCDNITIGLVSPLRPHKLGLESHRRVSASLVKYANWTRNHIRDEEISAAQLPEVIQARKKPIRKPPHW